LATGVGFLFCVLLALFFPWEAAGSIIAIAASRVFDNLSDVYHGDLQHREQMTRIGASLVMKGPLGLAALAIAIQLTGSVTWASAALALVSALVFVLYDSQSGAGWPKGDRTAYRRLVGIAFPLAVVTALISLNTNVPRYFVEHHRGSGELGIFAALFYLTAAGTTVVTAAGQSISPRLARLYASGDRAGFHRLLWRVTILVCGCGLAGALLIPLGGQRLIALLYRPEYARFGDVLFWILAGTVPMFAASVTGYAITAAQQFRPQVPLFAITTLVTAAGCFWLVPASGMLGAAYAVNLAAAVQLAGSLIILRQAWRRA
jgi:O-antigen/teichoic acid export membrane protein